MSADVRFFCPWARLAYKLSQNRHIQRTEHQLDSIVRCTEQKTRRKYNPFSYRLLDSFETGMSVCDSFETDVEVIYLLLGLQILSAWPQSKLCPTRYLYCTTLIVLMYDTSVSIIRQQTSTTDLPAVDPLTDDVLPCQVFYLYSRLLSIKAASICRLNALIIACIDSAEEFWFLQLL